MGATLYLGLPIVSQKSAFVFESIAAAKCSGLSDSTNLTLIPNLGKVTGEGEMLAHVNNMIVFLYF